MQNVVRQYYENGNIDIEIYHKNNKIHREDGPAIIDYYKNGQIHEKKYIIEDMYYREKGPAIIVYYENGNIKEQSYYKDDKYHRQKGPAVVKYDEDGNINCAKYYLNGKLHRENGYAYIKYLNGKKIESEYFIQGELIITDDIEVGKELIIEEDDIMELYSYKFSLFENKDSITDITYNELLELIDSKLIILKMT